jgi:hypothetical protein
MSDVYNPETAEFERLQRLELEARDLAKRLEQTSGESREVIERDLTAVENRIERLRERLRRRLRAV